MRLAEVESALRAVVAGRDDLIVTDHPLVHRAGRFSFLRIASARIGHDDPVLLVRAGVHGDERSGPVALARHLGAVVDAAHARGVRLICYPLGNPSGYQAGTRYNADRDPGPDGNNDFLRYRHPDGSIGASLAPGAAFDGFAWASVPELGLALPAETALMHALLARDPLHQIRAALDLHQDHLTPGMPPGAYHYAFGDLGRYRAVVERIRAHCPILAGHAVGAGFGTRIDASGQVVGTPDAERAMTTDADGFIVRHDGTLSDLMHHLGVAHSVAAETSGATPLDVAVAVNRCWIEGLVALVAR
ncbi:MAG: succinylglutamate desuccinylase/aspartoacylase family protein [Ectothiorhodospiraceae bacterium]|nr:succinylglutamate desuccinylase/aspartoacylase family protein [Ectothiorhodospiraceae bacterium]